LRLILLAEVVHVVAGSIDKAEHAPEQTSQPIDGLAVEQGDGPTVKHKVVEEMEEQEDYRHWQRYRLDFLSQVRILSKSAIGTFSFVRDDIAGDHEV